MAKIAQKEQAIKLRKKGLSIGLIAQEVGVSKGTTSYWCRDIQLSISQINKLQEKRRSAGINALIISAEKKRAQRIKNTKLFNAIGRRSVGNITKRDLFVLGLALYWGEGYKKGNEETGFTNSDPKIILFIIKWFKEIYKIKQEMFILRVSINNTHKERIDDVLKYWSDLTVIPLKQFTKSSFIKTKSKKIYSNHNQHFGTLRIKVRRGTNLRRQILGSISALGKLTD